jgi:ribosomal protein S18 acetylase RimI-like enzyme
MDQEDVLIRPYGPGDLDDLYRICLLTADNGRDATGIYQDPQLPGHLFAAPYGLFEPDLAFVAADAGGVGGYILGALDTRAFENRLEDDWWPQLRSRYPEPPAQLPEDHWTQDQRAAHIIHHRFTTPADITDRYPSHLHVDLLPRLQSRGLGRRLMATLTAALREKGSAGLHLHVSLGNEPAARFYRHLGFTELPSDDVRIFGMDLQAPQ